MPFLVCCRRSDFAGCTFLFFHLLQKKKDFFFDFNIFSELGHTFVM